MQKIALPYSVLLRLFVLTTILAALLLPVRRAAIEARETHRLLLQYPAEQDHQAAVAKRIGAERFVNRYGIVLLWIPPGDFMMGSEDREPNERPRHPVTIKSGFFMGQYEVTQGQWRKVMGTTLQQQRDRSNGYRTLNGEGGDYPMYYVSCNDASEFIDRLNGQHDDYLYRLPTEAEWEYACRAGTTGDHAGNLDAMAWYGNNSGRRQLDSDAIWRTDPQNYAQRLRDNRNQSHPVGQKLPNGFGLYDMQGNVMEWCQDWYHDSYDGAPANGTSWSGSGAQKYRILRGGSWGLDTYDSRVAVRDSYYPVTRALTYGFRVVAVRRTDLTGHPALMSSSVPETRSHSFRGGQRPPLNSHLSIPRCR